MNLREKLFGKPVPLVEKLAMTTANSTNPVLPKKNEFTYTKPEPEIKEPIKFGLPEYDTLSQPRKITKEMLKFQDSSPGFRGMSYVEEGDKTTFLDEFDYQAPPVKEPIKRIEIQDPRDATAPDTNKQGVVIEDPERLALANTIKAVADEVAPEYTDYLLRLAWYEGRYGSKTENKNEEEKGVDRGVFQINNKAFPDVPDEFAQDPVKSTLWAISVIESGNQKKWIADPFVKNAKISYE